MKTHEGQIALIDMDGTVADYSGAIRRSLKRLSSPYEPDLPDDIHNVPDWLERRMNMVKSQDGFWRELPPITRGLLVVDILVDMGFVTSVLTKGPNKTRSAWTEKAQWCDKYLPGSPLFMVDAEQPERHKALVYGRVLFDDFPPYAEAWLKVRPRGRVLMLERSYNTDWKHERALIIRESWDDKKVMEEISLFLAD